jgi:hypothetical protein
MRVSADFSKLYDDVPSAPNENPLKIEADLCICGATAAGIAAAVQARRMGLTAVIAEFSRKIGGISARGLGAADHGRKEAIRSRRSRPGSALSDAERTSDPGRTSFELIT